MCRRRRIRESAGRGDGLGLLPLDLAVAGAYTAVDRAGSEPELALAVNGMAPRAASDCTVAMGVILPTIWAPACLFVAAHETCELVTGCQQLRRLVAAHADQPNGEGPSSRRPHSCWASTSSTNCPGSSSVARSSIRLDLAGRWPCRLVLMEV